MPIDVKLYDTSTLLGVMQQMEPPSNYFLNLFFNRQVVSDDQYIDFEKLSDNRKLAPFVAPTAQGRPIYEKGSNVTRLVPAYIKPKDVVDAARQLARAPGELLAPAPMSPEARFNAAVADVTRVHRNAIERRWEWLAAKAILDGQVTIADADHPERVVNFGRASNHTVVKTSGQYWSDSFDIIGDIETWRQRVRRALFGGATNRLTVGVDAWDVMRKNAGLLAQLKTDVRGTDGNFRTGIRAGETVEYMGQLASGLDVYVYNDYYHDASGAQQPFMSSKDVLLSGPGVDGVRAFGAILDKGASIRPLPIFTKMWDQEDPSATVILSQSAPLMVPVNPNCTLKATVLA